MISNLRLRDFPTFIRTTDADDVMLTINIKQCELDAPAADGILLNTYDDLERAALDAIRERLPNTFVVGPLGPEVSPPSYLPFLTSSLWKEDGRCIAWLDAQAADGSVMYVNFGSIVVMTSEQLVEFAWGLAKSGRHFLWIIRPDLVKGDTAVLPPEFSAETVERGLVASWCPQQQVLNHPAVGAFLTHAGWSSLMESFLFGHPLVMLPLFADQGLTARVMAARGVGLEVPRDERDGSFGRADLASTVRRVMAREDEEGKALARNAREFQEMLCDRARQEEYVDELVEHLRRLP